MTQQTRRPSDYQLHGGLFKGGVYVVFAMLAMFLLGAIRLLGVFEMHPGWLTASLVGVIGILYVFLKGAMMLFALSCPECGRRTLQPVLSSSRWRTRHECRNCGYALLSGRPIASDDA